MVYLSKCLAIVLFVSLTASASADVLVSFGDGVLDTDFSWDAPHRTITIYTANGNHYKFYVHNGGGTPGTGVINEIKVHHSATGNFTLTIDDPSGTPNVAGASDWRYGYLRWNYGTSTLGQVQIANDLAADDDVQVDYLTGTMHIEGDVLGNFAVQKLLSGSIIIDGNVVPVLNNTHPSDPLYSVLQINRMAPGSLFRCQNMERGSDCNDADDCYRHAMVLGSKFTDPNRATRTTRSTAQSISPARSAA